MLFRQEKNLFAIVMDARFSPVGIKVKEFNKRRQRPAFLRTDQQPISSLGTDIKVRVPGSLTFFKDNKKKTSFCYAKPKWLHSDDEIASYHEAQITDYDPPGGK